MSTDLVGSGQDLKEFFVRRLNDCQRFGWRNLPTGDDFSAQFLIIHKNNYNMNKMETVYLHGFATTPEIWYRQVSGVALRLDFTDLERSACQVVAALSGPVNLIGWSMGGMVALQVAAKVPDQVHRLMLVSTTPKFLQSEDWPYGVSATLLRRLEKRIEREGIGAFHQLIFNDLEQLGLAELSAGQAKRELAELARVDLRPLLGRISQPTLIVQGDKDEITLPGAAQYLQKNILGSRLEVFAGVGHVPFLERALEFNKLLKDFIQ